MPVSNDTIKLIKKHWPEIDQRIYLMMQECEETLPASDFETRLVVVMSAAWQEIRDLRQWVADCQAGMSVNCVYCGHNYGPDKSTPVAMSDVLKKHIEKCPKHPLAAAKRERDELLAAIEYAGGSLSQSHTFEVPPVVVRDVADRLNSVAKDYQ